MENSFYRIENDIDFSYLRGNKVPDNGFDFTYYQDKLSDNEFYQGELPIELAFKFFDRNSELADFYNTTISHVFMNARKTFAVSEKLKKLLQQLRLPEHRFYPANITSVIGNGPTFVIENYFVFHTIHNYFDEINFNKSQFAATWFGEYDEETQTIEKYFEVLDKGSISNLDDFNKTTENIKSRGNSVSLMPIELYYKNYYDILTAESFIYISNKAKDLFEANQIRGYSLKAFNQDAKLHRYDYIPLIVAIS